MKAEHEPGKRGPKPGSEKARRGGLAVKAKYGVQFFRKIGSMGGVSVMRQRGDGYAGRIGGRGGRTTQTRRRAADRSRGEVES